MDRIEQLISSALVTFEEEFSGRSTDLLYLPTHFLGLERKARRDSEQVDGGLRSQGKE